MKNKIIPIAFLFLTGFSYGQLSPTENYIYSKTYLSDPTLPNSRTSETVEYIDGLGRTKQIVNVKATPHGMDVVNHIEYDQAGRQAKNYLPIPQTGTQNGGFYGSPLSTVTQTPYGSEKIFSEQNFENSPLNRVKQQFNVGNEWSSKPVNFTYDTNIANEVRKITTLSLFNDLGEEISSHLVKGSFYGVGTLYKFITSDEDNQQTITFVDKYGKTILVRKVLNSTTNADTYYIYNTQKQLIFVIPPEASKEIALLPGKPQLTAIPEELINKYFYQYKYDEKNRLIEKKIPGKGWEFMVYDKADRLIMTQDANLFQQSKWLITKYDQFGRVIYTGIIAGGTRESMQNQAGNSVITEARNSSGFTRNGMQIYYSNGYFLDIETVLSVNYYDTYPVGSPAIPTQILGQNILHENAQLYSISTKTLPVASYVKNIEDDNWTKSYSWYDTKGRPVASHSVNHLGGYTKTESELDFSGTPLRVITKHKRLDSDTEKVITETFSYDNQNRLKVHKHKIDNSPEEILAQNEYNELSQLKTKKVGGVIVGSGLQTVDYTYNIRGWMTQINNPADLSGGDLFGYEIKYTNPENTGLSTGRFNGNIAEIDWKTSTNPNDNKRRYSYTYDALNRLQQGVYTEPGSSLVSNDYYNEQLTYDLNGNIATLKRFAKPNTGTTAEKIDDLIYNYTGNRLDQITLPPGELNNYSGYNALQNVITYDSNGSMINHLDKGITSIVYNILNLPSNIINGTGKLKSQTNYIYRADGTKLSKYFGSNTSSTTVDYLDGFQYYYYTGLLTPLKPSGLQFVPTSEGYYDFTENKYIYNYSDHLGNVRLSYFKNISGSIEVLEENNYYPFGLKHQGYNALTGNPNYNYKYNGKELQESGMYDYGARFYMPDIGRWGVVDPFAEKMRRFSPYNYAWDNPIRFIDPDGMFAIPPDDYLDVNGRYLGSDGAATKNVRVINRTDWNTISSDNGGSLSATATTALQASSSIITINNTQINSDINNANNETLADQTKERQVWVGIEVTRGDIPTAQVTSVRGPDGTDGETVISTSSRSDAAGNVVKTNFDGTNLIAASQVHTHNVSQKPDTKTIPGTSPPDANTSKSYKMPIYAVDSYTGSQKSGNRISRVIPNGTTNTAGTTAAHNIGQETLNQFVNKQKYP